MPACGRNLQGMAGLGLPDDIGEVGDASLRMAPRLAGLLATAAGALDDRPGARGQPAAVVLHELTDMVDRAHASARNEGGFAGGGGGHDDIGNTGLHGRAHSRQDAAHRMDGAVQAELADVDGAGQHRQSARGQQITCSEHRQRQRHVESGAGLAQVRRREVDRQALLSPGDAADRQRGSYAFARLAHGGVGKAHEGEAGQSRTRVGLNIDKMPLQAGQGHGKGARQAHDAPTPR